jgi:hypothetical protein
VERFTAIIASLRDWWYSVSFLDSVDLIIGALVAFLLFLFRRFFSEIRNQIDQRLPSIAKIIVDGIERFLIGAWLHLSTRFEHKYKKTLRELYRVYRTEGLRTRGPFALDLE